VRARWTAIQNDARFGEAVRPALLALGFAANLSAKEWLADELLPFSTSAAAYTDQRNDMNKVRRAT
jgi:hypothetical protein